MPPGSHGGTPVSVPVVPGAVVPVLPSLAEAPCVVSPELASTVVVSTVVALAPVVVLPAVPVVVVLPELVACESLFEPPLPVDCDADSLADPPSVGAVVVGLEAVAPVASDPPPVEPALALADSPALPPQADRTHQAVTFTTFIILGIIDPPLSPSDVRARRNERCADARCADAPMRDAPMRDATPTVDCTGTHT